MRKLLVLLFALSISALLTCEKRLAGPEDVKTPAYNSKVVPLDSIRIRPYEIKILDYQKLPYNWWGLADFENYPKDDDGIILFEWQGNYYYNSTQIVSKMLHFIASYKKTKDEKYHIEADKFGNKLLDLAISKNGAIYFQFDFYWPFKDNVFALNPPWYCGMTQGQALSAFIRLYDYTKDDKYLHISRLLMQSLINFKGASEPWVVLVDQDNYYWIEHYPEDEPNHVLNGFVFALFGLYDYYRILDDQTALFLFRAGVTTIADHINDWRTVGGVSRYASKYNMSSIPYHAHHIQLLYKLYDITGDIFFKQQAELFKQDFYTE